MDITDTLNEIASFSIEDRIRLVQAIEDSTGEQAYSDLTEAQKRKLDYRIDDDEMNSNNVLIWRKSKHYQSISHSR